MVYTPSEKTERHRYIENSIETTLQEMEIPAIRNQLGARAILFAELLNNAVITNERHGVISLPADYDYESAALPIATFDRNDELLLSSDFNTQTPAQRLNAVKTYRSWEPRDQSAEDFYEFYARKSYSPLETPMNFAAFTAGAIGVTATLIPTVNQIEWFSKAPNKGLAVVKQRPIMLLEQKPGRQGDSSSTVAHELTHVDQITRQPVELVYSQRSADMQALRQELEAYHYGFPFSAVELVEVGSADIKDGSTLVQINVEWIRMHNTLDPSDPFKPSGFIQKKLQEGHVGNILHGAIDYDHFVSLVGKESVAIE